MLKFNVVIPKDNGAAEYYPLKEWLRQNPQHIPQGLDATHSTSHQLRNGLKKKGWSVQNTETDVCLFMPGADGMRIEEVLDDGEIAEETAPETSFGLEFQLRDFIADNISAIKFGEKPLKLYVDPTGRDGIEYSTPVGFIDILAMDNEGNFIVLELKRARSPDHAVGQLSRYMGWVMETIGKGKSVKGIIVAKNIGNKMQYARFAIPNIDLFEYEVSFKLNPANDVRELN